MLLKPPLLFYFFTGQISLGVKKVSSVQKAATNENTKITMTYSLKKILCSFWACLSTRLNYLTLRQRLPSTIDSQGNVVMKI